MECFVHPGQHAVGACVACGNFVCDVCRVSIRSRIYCKACVERGEATPPPAGGGRSPSGSASPLAGPLRRSRTDRIIGGVCAGLAKQFGMDPSIARILAAVVTFVTGVFPGAVVYAILWAVLPEGD
jgi:phage shock protein PspC (stress-responsive transcriptional regulator)